MKRRFLWLVALAGVVWLYLRRGGRPEPAVGVSSEGDPAERLRRKLDETKGRDEEPVSHLATPEPEAEPVESPEADDAPGPAEQAQPVVAEELEARRREVHERARAASDEMRRSSSD